MRCRRGDPGPAPDEDWPLRLIRLDGPWQTKWQGEALVPQDPELHRLVAFVTRDHQRVDDAAAPSFRVAISEYRADYKKRWKWRNANDPRELMLTWPERSEECRRLQRALLGPYAPNSTTTAP